MYHGQTNHSLTPKYHVELIFENGTRQNCFDTDRTEFGWCGVCDPKARKVTVFENPNLVYFTPASFSRDFPIEQKI